MKLLIGGAGGHGRVVAEAALSMGEISEVAFLDDRFPDLALQEGWPVIGKLSQLAQLRAEFGNYIAAFGDSRLRLESLREAKERNFATPTIRHKASVVSPRAMIGAGSAIAAGAIVNIGAKIGDGCIINTGATVDHDCVLHDGVHICPGAHLAGSVRAGLRSWIGIGAVVKQGVKIGSDVVVGAGAVVIEDLASGVTVVGNPLRVLKGKTNLLRGMED